MLSNEKNINNFFYYWLLFSFFLVLIMIIVGGLTRLTNSGLSITQWELFKGIFPPLDNTAWENYFSLYKEIPQYEIINKDMSLQEFKIIFYWEYAHRILGRIIGLFFLLPVLYFSFKKNINQKYLNYCYLILLLVILQGIIGWYMVKSGLVNNISVSHYRLSLHLIMAFLIISIIFWLILNIINKTQKYFFKKQKYNYLFYFLIIMIFIQIILGAFVSGLDAGKIYQTWPLMNNNYFPDDVLLNNFYDFLNFDNHSLIQFYHRNIAYLIFFFITALGFFIFKQKLNSLFKPYFFVVFFLFLQIVLGIFTLISGLNIFLASAHQIGSLGLVLSVIYMHYIHIK